MREGKLIHRQISAEQPALMSLAIDNYRYVQRLTRD
jgi:hypothetical protein